MGMSTFSTDPFLSLVVATDHDARLRRAADERRSRERLRRRGARES